MNKYIAILLLIITAATSGCVTGRRALTLQIPTAPTSAGNRGEICVTSVVDNRVFQNNPSGPDMPSVDGDASAMTQEQKDLMIGRQRNTFGKALGDISLTGGDSVTKRARLLVEEALKGHGYSITPNTSAANTATVSVDEFWAWFSPGMWSVGFEARVYCTVVLKNVGTSEQIVIKGYGENRGQGASNANWQRAYELAFKDFMTKFESEISKTKF